jgi:hypothetical protein
VKFGLLRKANSCFGQLDYFGVWRDAFFIELAEDSISDAKDSFWYIGVRKTFLSVILQNLYLAIKNL